MSQYNHPDSHALDDWPLYGPRNPDIARLVVQLAEQHQMQLTEIEAIMLVALNRQLTQSAVAPDNPGATTDHALGQNQTAQKELLVQAYETGDNDRIEQALLRVTTARRMNKTGRLAWQSPAAEMRTDRHRD